MRDLTEAGVPCGSVREISEVLADPQITAREMVREVEHGTIGRARVINSPVKMSETPTSVRTYSAFGGSSPSVWRNSIGIGKTIVELFVAPISSSVCR